MAKNYESILEYNREFVAEKKYLEFETDKFPSRKLAILSCMDTRLTALLPAALGLKNGETKIIKNAGGVISHPFGSVMLSLLVAIYELGVEEIMVIGHYDCGMEGLKAGELIPRMRERGISDETLKMVELCGCSLENWLCGFDNVSDSVRRTVEQIKTHPLIPSDIRVYGLIMDPKTGELTTLNS
ncbi:MAG: carbonic anhydrase [Oscillospiraceae bacterium]